MFMGLLAAPPSPRAGTGREAPDNTQRKRLVLSMRRGAGARHSKPNGSKKNTKLCQNKTKNESNEMNCHILSSVSPASWCPQPAVVHHRAHAAASGRRGGRRRAAGVRLQSAALPQRLRGRLRAGQGGAGRHQEGLLQGERGGPGGLGPRHHELQGLLQVTGGRCGRAASFFFFYQAFVSCVLSPLFIAAV